ncbi:MAG TPA: hypothetical protein VET82_04620 [Candidatus Eisenbacteria bacterium]|nr:hypothetical protein [Candidatus Eisenbacteria bacterium]
MSQTQPTARPRFGSRLLGNRGIWKEAIFVTAFLTYLCSFLFFGLAAAETAQNGASLTGLIDLVAAIYFLLQVIFLFVLAWVVERRRHNQSIDFPNRRQER